MKCHADYFSQIFSVPNGYAVFCYGTGHSYNINLLKGIISNQWKWHLTGNANKRNAVKMRICKSCNNIGGTRSAGYQAYARLSGSSRISFCLMNQSLLMSGKHQVNIILFI